MHLKRTLIRVSIGVAAVCVVAGVVLYLVANGTPTFYQPAVLDQAQREQAARQFLRRIQDFGNAAEDNKPFTWTITQDELNSALSSMDEIADRMEEGKATEVYKVMAKMGVSGPAVAMNKNVLTIMVRSDSLDKVISADLAFSFTADKKMKVRLAATRLGRLPLPASSAEEWINKLKVMLAKDVAKAPTSHHSASFGGLSPDQLAAALTVIIAAVDEKPISAEVTWPVNNRRVRIEAIHIAGGEFTLSVVPIGRKTATTVAK